MFFINMIGLFTKLDETWCINKYNQTAAVFGLFTFNTSCLLLFCVGWIEKSLRPAYLMH